MADLTPGLREIETSSLTPHCYATACSETRSSTANAARYVVRASSYPRHRFSSGFYPIFALSVLLQTKSFWLQANVRAWTGRNGDHANHSSGVVTAATSFSPMAVTFLLEWFVMMIEVPKRSTYVSIGTEERTLRENWNIEASRSIAGALTRRRLRWRVPL